MTTYSQLAIESFQHFDPLYLTLLTGISPTWRHWSIALCTSCSALYSVVLLISALCRCWSDLCRGIGCGNCLPEAHSCANRFRALLGFWRAAGFTWTMVAGRDWPLRFPAPRLRHQNAGPPLLLLPLRPLTAALSKGWVRSAHSVSLSYHPAISFRNLSFFLLAFPDISCSASLCVVVLVSNVPRPDNSTLSAISGPTPHCIQYHPPLHPHVYLVSQRTSHLKSNPLSNKLNCLSHTRDCNYPSIGILSISRTQSSGSQTLLLPCFIPVCAQPLCHSID